MYDTTVIIGRPLKGLAVNSSSMIACCKGFICEHFDGLEVVVCRQNITVLSNQTFQLHFFRLKTPQNPELQGVQ